MTLLNDKQIARLAEKDIFLPYVGEKRRTLDNGTKAISYGLSNHISPKLEAGRVKYCPRTIVAGIAYIGVPLVYRPLFNQLLTSS